jgi:hypothetical protein
MFGVNKVARTAQDGSYSFPELDVGGMRWGFYYPVDYYVTAYAPGFVDSIYGVQPPDRSKIAPIHFGPSGNLDHIDLRLAAIPDIVQMEDGPLAAEYPERRQDLSFDLGGFSPDGSYFAFATTGAYLGDPEQAWRYDMHARRLVAVTGKAMPSLSTRVSDLQWMTDTLYVRAFSGLSFDVWPPRSFVAMTPQGTKTLSALPPAVQAAIDQRALEQVAGSFRFNLERPCHGCPWDLWVRDTRSSRGKQRALTIDWNRAVADPAQPIVFYGVAGFVNRIGSFDLRTRQSNSIALPSGRGIGATVVLAAEREQNGFLMAFSTRDACIPEPRPDGLSSLVLFDPVHSEQQPKPMRICFVRIPDKQ